METEKATSTRRKRNLVVKVKRLSETAVVPCRKSESAAGYDLYVDRRCSVFPTGKTISGNAAIVPTGIALEIPNGYHGKIFLRSSTGAKTKLRLANGTGIIDSDYRGEVKLLIENVGGDIEYIEKGDRIAQIIIERNEDVTFEESQKLTDTKRGAGGIGSTGKGA